MLRDRCAPATAASVIIRLHHALSIMSNYVPGQRWISNAEPELGLGTVLRVEGRMVQLVYARTGTVRQYATHSAPLTRAQFRAGDMITLAGKPHRVDDVDQRDGLFHYVVHGSVFCETALDDLQSVSKAEDRLNQGRVDRNDQFEFRYEALMQRASARRSAAFGLQSARVDLIPHQLKVAQIAADRRPPRVLLADEVGLGKTIEAGLILARHDRHRPRRARAGAGAGSADVPVVRRIAAALQPALLDLRRRARGFDRAVGRIAQSLPGRPVHPHRPRLPHRQQQARAPDRVRPAGT
jgi:hypothetical protein